MSKVFFEVFPTLKLDTGLHDLFENVTVEKVTSTRRKDFLRVYIASEHLIHKEDVFRVEREIGKQFFPNMPIVVKFYEHFTLSSQYDPEKLMDAYRESIGQCLAHRGPVPQWYVAVDGEQITGGLGVIENDFHNRKDLTPNVCAVYVEEAYRCRGIAGALLEYACADMAELGVDTLYLLTDHMSFYERYGWQFLCMAQGDGDTCPSRMYVRRWSRPCGA